MRGAVGMMHFLVGNGGPYAGDGMRPIFLPLAVLGFLSGCALTPPAAPSLAAADTVQERALFLRVNAHRDSLGRRSLVYDPELSNLARRHSQEMAAGLVPFGHAG